MALATLRPSLSGTNFLVAGCDRFPYAENMHPSVLASAAAAADLGYPGLGEIIDEWRLSPHALVVQKSYLGPGGLIEASMRSSL